METKNKVYCGVDWSMSCPSICIWEDRGQPIHFLDTKIHYMIDDKKYIGVVDNTTGHQMYTEWTCDEERFENLAEWGTELLTSNGVSTAFIEGYSMGSRGKVFNIGENTGMLKYLIWKNIHSSVITLPPATVKKFASGKGNADKNMMYAAFEKETGFSLVDKLNPVKVSKSGKVKVRSAKIGSPIGDIVDSYYVLKCGIAGIYSSSSSSSKLPLVKA